MTLLLAFLIVSGAFAQTDAGAPGAKKTSAADISTDQLLSEPGPTFRVPASALTGPLTLIAYGDQRFTDPANTKATDPRVRKWLVQKIAQEKPSAIVLNGDVPLSGAVENDYAVYAQETSCWRDAKLNVFPALGNHEFHGDPYQALEHWWTAFPQMRNRRWYSAQLGERVYIIALDSDTSLVPGSNQAKWLDAQMKGVPASVDLILITMHHPPVADVQKHLEVDHNPRPNEIALRDYLAEAARLTHARILVSAGHIHNYERHEVDNVVYFVSGGGGAHPYYVERTPDDLYQSILFPNFHYIKLTLDGTTIHGQMMRVADPEASTLSVEVKDSFDVALKPR